MRSGRRAFARLVSRSSPDDDVPARAVRSVDRLCCPRCTYPLSPGRTAVSCPECRSRNATLSAVVGTLFVRLVLSGCAVLAALVLLVAAAIPYGGGSGATSFAVYVVFVCTGWTLLPLVRTGRPAAAFPGALWLALAFRPTTIGVDDRRGWMLGPWALATVIVLISLKVNPGAVWRPSKSRSSAPETDA